MEEPNLEIGDPIDCNVVVNRHIELTEEEKAEQKALALRRYQDEELRKLQMRSNKPKARHQETQVQEHSLFDMFE